MSAEERSCLEGMRRSRRIAGGESEKIKLRQRVDSRNLFGLGTVTNEELDTEIAHDHLCGL